jgi:outer membrane receptor protein involved in Fe transport
VAAGAEYRQESANQTVDALSAAHAFAIGNPQAFSGGLNVKEAFVETVAPLVKSVPGIQLLELNAAGRATDYSTSGFVTTWKVGLNWTVWDDLRLRATRSRDIRAPNITELYTKPVQQSVTVIDPANGTQYIVQQYSTGNTALKPEIADTVAAGFVMSPHYIPGFEASVDYYDINIASAISTLALQDIVNRCYDGTTSLCSLITRSNGLITSVTNPYLNLSKLETNGFDIEASYRTHLAGGQFQVRALANNLMNYIQNDGVNVTNTAGDMHNGLPKWTGLLTASYQWKQYQIAVDANYIGQGVYNAIYNATSLPSNQIASRTFVDLEGHYDLGNSQGRELFFKIGDIFNTIAPPIFAITGGPNYPRIGRNFTLGFRFKM